MAASRSRSGRRPLQLGLGAIGAALLLPLAFAPAAPATLSATEAVGYLNGQRAAAGIPKLVGINERLSEGCALHLAYLEANFGGVGENWQQEEAGKAGYTELGAQAASRSEVGLWVGGSAGAGALWSEGENPWANSSTYAPLRLAALLSPAATEGWYAERVLQRGRREVVLVCMGVNKSPLEGGLYPSSPTTFSYPGNGQAGVPFSVETAEGRSSTTEAPAPASRSGPYLIYWLLDGAAAFEEPQLRSYTLVGPEGTVETTVITPQTALFGAEGLLPLAAYVPHCAIAVPLAPLAPDTTYNATLEWVLPALGTVFQRTSFTTGTQEIPDPWSTGVISPQRWGRGEEREPGLTVRRIGDRLQVSSNNPAPVRFTVIALSPLRVVRQGTVLVGSRWQPKLPVGRYVVCVAQKAKLGFRRAQRCIPLRTPPRKARLVHRRRTVSGW